MAVLYYPKGNVLLRRDASSPLYEEMILANNPNTVIYFDTGSGANAASSSFLYITSSWALTASVTLLYATNSFQSVSSSYSDWAINCLSASYSSTSSFALNSTPGGSGGSSTASLTPYLTIVTSSTNWITASFLNSDQFIAINSGALYNFTCSNLPASNTSSNLSLFISNTAVVTCSLAFPSDWIFMGTVPTSLSSSRAAVLSLRNYGGTKTVATFAVQY